MPTIDIDFYVTYSKEHNLHSLIKINTCFYPGKYINGNNDIAEIAKRETYSKVIVHIKYILNN